MSGQALRLEPDPVLRLSARSVTQFSSELRRLAQDLIDTMHVNDGIGLAAPQIGWDVQVFVANPSQRKGRELVAVNPSVEPCSGRASILEGCLSLPDIWDRVRRPARVRLRALDVTGRPFTLEAEGLLAIVLQHEFDHLHGRLFIDRLSWFRRARAHARWRALKRAGAGRAAQPAQPVPAADQLATAPGAAALP